MMYASECWGVKKEDVDALSVAEMKILRWTGDISLRERQRNESIREKLRVAPITHKIKGERLRWYGHVQRRPADYICRKIQDLQIPGKGVQDRGKGGNITSKRTLKSAM